MKSKVPTPELPMPGLPPEGRHMAKHGVFTGANLKETEPETAQKIIDLFAGGRGLSFLQISRMTGVSRNTITAFLDSEGILSVEQLRQHVGKSSLQASALMVDRVLENPDAIPAAQLGMTAKLLGDMGNAMTGHANVVIEHQHRFVVSPDTLTDQIGSIRKQLRMDHAAQEIRPIADLPTVVEIEAKILPKSERVVAYHAPTPTE